MDVIDCIRDLQSKIDKMVDMLSPRLMTIEEVFQFINNSNKSECEEPLWIEMKSRTFTYLTVASLCYDLSDNYMLQPYFEAYYFNTLYQDYLKWKDYNVTWRCWSLKPSKELRKDVKWESRDD